MSFAELITEDVIKRFWTKVHKSENGCWEWVETLLCHGYGLLKIKGKTYRAHRISFFMHKGPLGEGLCVCHKCDNKRCVNPEHLFLGTNADNTKDMISKGRIQIGDRHWARRRPERVRRGIENNKAKLNPMQVRFIREMYANGVFQREIGEIFGVCQTVIGDIVRRETWRHVE